MYSVYPEAPVSAQVNKGLSVVIVPLGIPCAVPETLTSCSAAPVLVLVMAPLTTVGAW